MKTYSAKPSDVKRVWYVLDASEVSFGRVASKAAALLIGKEKPSFTSHIDTGDYVVIINAKDLVITGDKLQKKIYYRHSGYPGGLRATSLGDKVATDPTQVLYHAIRGMLPVNKLRDGRLTRLKIYFDNEHKHEPQKPVTITLVKKDA